MKHEYRDYTVGNLLEVAVAVVLGFMVGTVLLFLVVSWQLLR